MIVRAAAFLLTLAVPLSTSRAQGIDFTQGGPILVTARDGIEWRQGEQVVIANGDAKAVRGNVTVTADRLFAWYRRKGADAAGAQPASTGVNGSTETEGNEVYRLRAEGNVHIFTDTDQAWGDQATYDLDEAVLVLTGRALKLTTPNDTLTSRDTMEYWSQKRMAVARGDAVVVTNDARRVAADTLVAFTTDAPAQAAAKPPVQAQTGDTMAAMAGKLQRVEAFGDVSIRTVTDMVTGDRGVYVPDTDIGHLGGHVRITRGLNQVNGSEAVVNMKTGVATLLAGNDGRVTGLVVPNDASSGASPNEAAPQPPAKPKVMP
jgi:lipopolysaccharide export system protein LptA